MKYNSEKHHRRSIRLKNYDYSSKGGYFITLVTKDRQHLFVEIVNGKMFLSEIGKIAYNNWLDIPNHFDNVILDEFVIMPNHVHGIIFLSSNEDCVSLGGVKYYALTKELIDNQTNGITNEQTSSLAKNALTEEKENNLTKKELKNKIQLTDKNLKEDLKKDKSCTGVLINTPNKNDYFSKLSPKKNTISLIIRTYKTSVTILGRKNNLDCFQWQRNYYEHIIRNEKALNNIRKYIKENPTKWFIDKENEKSEYEKYKFKSIQEINDFNFKNEE